MSVRNWLRNNETGLLVALGLLIACGLTVFVTFSHPPSGLSGDKPEAASQQTSRQKRDWRPSFYPAEPYASYHNANCQAPKDREEADLCQQWRSAQAAEEIVATTDKQFGWNVAQAVSTIIAAFATGLAAWAPLRPLGLREIPWPKRVVLGRLRFVRTCRGTAPSSRSALMRQAMSRTVF
jgi:hypothetical protein